MIVIEINLWFVDIKGGNMKRLNSQAKCIIINNIAIKIALWQVK